MMAEDKSNVQEKQEVLPVAIAIATYQPIFADVAPVENEFKVPPDVMGILQAAESISIRQHVKILPKKCFACPPCVRQENTYSVYAGVANNAEAEFLRIDEVSDDWNRCCCAPYHPLTLEVRQYIPGPGERGDSDARFYGDDVSRDWSGFSRSRKQQVMMETYRRNPVLFSMVRDDGQRCVSCDCKCLSTVVCCGCCQDGMSVYSGKFEEEPNQDKGRHKNLPEELKMGSVLQPIFGGCCNPRLDLMDSNSEGNATPYGKIEGPCIFGGWSEMCCSFKFYTSLFSSPTKSGDIALITKKKPQSTSGSAVELVSNADNYRIDFDSSQNLTGAQKLTILSSQLLIDYMLFDGNTEKCRRTPNGCYCYLWYCSILGAVCPAAIFIPTKHN